MSVFFSADFHFGHSNIIKYCNRPFLCERDKQKLAELGGDWKNDHNRWRIDNESVSLMDSTIIDNINRVVGENDELWFLGDFCFAPKHIYYQTARNYRNRITCKHILLVKGNHDHSSINGLFERDYDQTAINVNGRHIVLNHYCMAVWNHSHRSSWQLYGHSHTQIEAWMDKIMPGRRSLDVGVDNAAILLGEYRPFSFEELEKILGPRSGYKTPQPGHGE